MVHEQQRTRANELLSLGRRCYQEKTKKTTSLRPWLVGHASKNGSKWHRGKASVSLGLEPISEWCWVWKAWKHEKKYQSNSGETFPLA